MTLPNFTIFAEVCEYQGVHPLKTPLPRFPQAAKLYYYI